MYEFFSSIKQILDLADNTVFDCKVSWISHQTFFGTATDTGWKFNNVLIKSIMTRIFFLFFVQR